MGRRGNGTMVEGWGGGGMIPWWRDGEEGE